MDCQACAEKDREIAQLRGRAHALEVTADVNYGQETVKLTDRVKELEAEVANLDEREANDHLDSDRAADVAALVKLSEFLTAHGRRQTDASSVDAVIRWVGELQGAVLAGDALI